MKAKNVGFAALTLTLCVSWGASAQPLPPGYALKTGFPASLPGAGHPTNEPVWASLGLGSGKSLIVGTSSKQLWVVNANGIVASGWPQPLGGQAVSSAAVGNLGGGNGATDIVVGFGGGVWPPVDPTDVGGVAAFRRDGSLLWVVLSANDVPSHSSFPLGVVSTPAIADIDGDGVNEVVWGSYDGHIYVVDGRTGAAKPGNWPLFVRDTIWSSPVLYDLDGDGKLEIIIGTDSHADGTANPPGVPPTINGGRLHVLTNLGTEYPGFPYDVDQMIMASPVVGDITGDGTPKIVFGTGTYWGNPAPCGSGIGPLRRRTIYALTCTGQLLPGFGVANMTSGEVTTSPALADLDGDGVLDVVVTDMDCSTGTPQNFNAYAFKGTGALLWKTKPLAYAGVNLNAGQPVVGDVLGDSKLEVLVPTNSEICILSNTGAQLTDAGLPHNPGEFSLYMPTPATSATLAVDAGALNVAAASTSGANVVVYAWTTPKTAASPWGSYRRDATRQAVAPGAGTCTPRTPVSASFHPLTPCRVLDTRNPLGPYGAPALQPETVRVYDATGVCGVPAGAVAISANLTATNVIQYGDLILYPSDVGTPNTSSLALRPGKTRANNGIVYLSTTTKFSVFNSSIGALDFVLDVNGYFQ